MLANYSRVGRVLLCGCHATLLKCKQSFLNLAKIQPYLGTELRTNGAGQGWRKMVEVVSHSAQIEGAGCLLLLRVFEEATISIHLDRAHRPVLGTLVRICNVDIFTYY